MYDQGKKLHQGQVTCVLKHTFKVRYTAQASEAGMNGKHARGSKTLSFPPLQSPV